MTFGKEIFMLNEVPQDFFQPRGFCAYFCVVKKVEKHCHRGSPEVGRGAANFVDYAM